MLAVLARRSVGSQVVELSLAIILVLFCVFCGSQVFGEEESTSKSNPPGVETPIEFSDTVQAATSDDSAKSEKSTESTQTTDAVEKKVDKHTSVGEPLAPGMMQLLNDEILTSIKKRGTTENLARFQSYAIGRLNASAGRYTGSELTGNCRLGWYDYMMRHLLDAPAAAEKFTRELHLAVCDDNEG